ncbi:MAG TPA: hypothetical protein VGN00_13170 [Puia sp.]
MRKVFTLIITVGLLAGLHVSGQSQTDPPFRPEPTPQAPNSATLGRFGDYAVSYFTGVPNISIPLYEIKAGNLTVPISIKYHASGIKVTDVSGWVGLGWALDAGGELSRRILGATEDEANNIGYIYQPHHKAVDINTSDRDDQDTLDWFNRKLYDAEPDIYSYSFPGGSGKLFLNCQNNYLPEPIPFSPLRIQRTGEITDEAFHITDQSGNLYDYVSQEQSTSTWGPSNRYGWSALNTINAHWKDGYEIINRSVTYNNGNHEDLCFINTFFMWLCRRKGYLRCLLVGQKP